MKHASVPAPAIVEAAKKCYHVPEAKVELVYDEDENAFQVLSIRRNEDDGWETAVMRRVTFHHGFVLSINGGSGFIAELGQPNIAFHETQLCGLELDENLVGLKVKFDVLYKNGRPEARYILAD